MGQGSFGVYFSAGQDHRHTDTALWRFAPAWATRAQVTGAGIGTS